MVALKCCIGNKDAEIITNSNKDAEAIDATKEKAEDMEKTPPVAEGDKSPEPEGTTTEGTVTTGTEGAAHQEGSSPTTEVNPDAAEAEGFISGGGAVKHESAEPTAVEGDQVNVEVVDKDDTAV